VRLPDQSFSVHDGLNRALELLASPFATRAEALVLSWLAPYFGMQGGHFCAGSTLANLTGIWAARDVADVKIDRLELWGRPQTAVNVFRPVYSSTPALVQALPPGTLSTCVLDGQTWARPVAANPSVDMDTVVERLMAASRIDA
jgi:hypothetical protein